MEKKAARVRDARDARIAVRMLLPGHSDLDDARIVLH
jgi:hypothetical protein